MGRLFALAACVFYSLTSAVLAQQEQVHAMTPIPSPRNDIRPELVNGVPAEPAEWPATLLFEHKGSLCTSTIVGETAIITAAHCVEDKGKAKLLFNGSWKDDLTCHHHTQYKGAVCTIEQIVGCTADVALCVAAEPFDLSAVRVEEINSNADEVHAGDNLELLGFGCEYKGGPPSGVVLIGSSTIQSMSVQGASTTSQYALQEYIIVEGKEKAVLCNGDSGGAAYSSRRVSDRKIIGIGSRGNVSSTSYFVNVTDPIIRTFFKEWDLRGVAICGISPGGKGC